jgi:hypothetical protein
VASWAAGEGEGEGNGRGGEGVSCFFLEHQRGTEERFRPSLIGLGGSHSVREAMINGFMRHLKWLPAERQRDEVQKHVLDPREE